jgi:hypothetical protein
LKSQFKNWVQDDEDEDNLANISMGLTLEGFMAWKAEEMTMNTSSPRVAKSRDLVADFKKGIKRDPSLFPSLKHIDNWPTFKCETMAQAFAQDVVNVFNPKYKPRGSEEKDLFTLQLCYVYAIFCSNLKSDFGRKLVWDHESSQNAQAIWKELSNDAEKYVTLPHYFDANLYHDMVTGRSVTAILHFLNQNQMDWCSKKQATVETATFGSEFIAARTTIDQIVDLRMTLCYLGIPIQEKSYVFGDNKTVINASSTPHAKLHKRHNTLSFHHVQEAVTSKNVTIFHLLGEYNPADILSRHWAYALVWRTINALLFARGDTWDLLDDECREE